MKQVFKNYISLLTFLILLAILSGCTNVKPTNKVDDAAVNSISINIGSRNIIIKNKTDMQNIKYLLSELKNKTNSVVSNGYIQGTIVYENRSESFCLTDKTVTYNGNTYADLEILNSLMNIIKPYMHSIDIFIQNLREASEITLYAQDATNSIKLNSQMRQELIAVLTSDTFVYTDEIPGNIISEYPGYRFEVKDRSGYNIGLGIYNKNMIFCSNDKEETIDKYKCNPSLLNLALKWMRVNTTNDTNQLDYLYNSTKLNVYGSQGIVDYSSRLLLFIRLIRGSEIKTNVPTGLKSDMKLEFFINNEKIVIPVFKDGYIYRGKYYYKKGILNDITSLYTAG